MMFDPVAPAEPTLDLDVLIVGAGLSGVDAAYRLQTLCPDKSYAILEARDAIGGTWDLFRYPGIRSDSDMHTLGFPFRPWRGEKAIADGADIRDYIRDTAQIYGIDRKIRFGHRVVGMAWSSETAQWTVGVETADGESRELTCRFLFMCSGYYDYSGGYTPEFPGRESFGGRFVHPQAWPEDMDVSGKRIVVIGSGATAVTLVPALIAQGAHVTMLQRSPTYIVSRAARDGVAKWAHRLLPGPVADKIVRWKNIMYSIATYSLAKRSPATIKTVLLRRAKRQLGKGYDVGRHFTPTYNPWDQRICLVPDGDLFKAVRKGDAEIVTDRIASLTPAGIRLESGGELAADIIVSATGLRIKMIGGAEMTIDGQRVDLAGRMLYKGMMFSDVPNFALAFGYTNASWTLKCDLTARYVCRLLKHMDRNGQTICVPRLRAGEDQPEPMLDFSSGYVQRASGVLPRQGRQAPWRVHQNYVMDLLALKFGNVSDGRMQYQTQAPAPAAKERNAA